MLHILLVLEHLQQAFGLALFSTCREPNHKIHGPTTSTEALYKF